MTLQSALPASFYQRPVIAIARDLLGKKLVRILDNRRVSGVICETEAYDGEQDQACHARSGRTQRNTVMYGNPGHAYVYFTYGMHWMLNCVCGPVDYPAAVLIRALIPLEGLDMIASRREGIEEKNWCSGPARLTRALSIDRQFNGCDLTNDKNELFIEDYRQIPDEHIQATPRIGIQYAGEPWVSLPWRFLIQNFERIGMRVKK